MPTRLTLIGKPGCHLCDDAREVVSSVLDAHPELSVTVEEQNILEDAELHDRYWEEIPVVLINDEVHNYWRIDPVRLERALKEIAS
ncbi:MAG: glutaredoxin family protein [Mycetocola sp.]